MAAVMHDRAIVGAGTPEADWQAWSRLKTLPDLTLDTLLPQGSRAVVVAPHPDDEVLAFGGLLSMLAAAGRPLIVVAVTDGDASHPNSTRWTRQRLAQHRHAESLEGLRRLGARPESLVRLAFPDGRLREHAGLVSDALVSLLSKRDVVFTTWARDGHPDHEACADAVTQAAAIAGCRVWQAPVWMWHWAAPGDPRVPWSRVRRLALSADAARRKTRAIEAHATQLSRQDTGTAPVLAPSALSRLLRPHEYLFLPEDGAPPDDTRRPPAEGDEHTLGARPFAREGAR